MAPDSLWQLHALSLEPARLHSVSLEIARGVTAVIGWSGAGKTSLLNVLAGFEKPDAGRIAGAPRVAWVPQDGGLWPQCTAREHLEIAGASVEEIETLLADFHLGERGEAHPHELSLGGQSRLAVARALAAKAEVLVMDEPLVHVDPARSGGYWRAIRVQLAATGASLVFSTHVPETVLAEAGHVVCLAAGRVAHSGPVRALYDDPPSPELMTFLGPGNWLAPHEAQLWFGEKFREPRCFRPEQIEVAPVAASLLVVSEATFLGSVAEVELRHINAAVVARFFHRPSGPHLQPGTPVSLRLRE